MAKEVELDVDVNVTGEEGLDRLDADMHRAASSVDSLGDAARGTKRDMSSLDRQILETRASVAALGTEFAKTGDKDALKSFKDARGSLNNLKAVRSEVKDYEKDLERLHAEQDRKTNPPINITGIKDVKQTLKDLDDRIKTARLDVATLGDAFVRTGNEDVFRNLKDSRSALSGLQAVRKEIAALEGDEKRASERGGGVPDIGNFTGVLSAIGEKIPPQVLIPSVAALGAALGAALNGAVQLVGAGGLLAAGIIGAFQFPVVKAAFGDLGHDLKTEFVASTESLAQPLIDSTLKIRVAFQQLAPQLKSIFTSLAPDIALVTDGLIGFVQKLLPGFQKLAGASRPFFQVFADELPQTGAAVSAFFGKLNESALSTRGAVDGLRLVFETLNGLLGGLGDTLGGLSAAFEVFGGGLLVKLFSIKSAAEGIETAFAGIVLGPILGELASLGNLLSSIDSGRQKATTTQWVTPEQRLQIGGMATSASNVAAAFQNVDNIMSNLPAGIALTSQQFGALNAALNATSQTSDRFIGSVVDKVLNGMLGMDQATLQFQTSLTGVAQALATNHNQLDANALVIEKNKVALNSHAAAGQADRSAILQAVAANIRNYNAMIDAGLGADEASNAYDSNTTALYKTLRAAGLNDQAIDGMIGKYRGVPKTVSTALLLQGVQTVLEDIDNVLRHMAGIHDKYVSINVRTIYQSYGALAPGLAGLTPTSAALHHKGAIGGVFPYEQGGVTSYAGGGGYSRSGILRPSNPGTILAGEPQTGGEVFVPRLGIAAARGLALADVAASWHGGHVVAGGQSWQGGGSMQVVVTSSDDGSSAEQSMAKIVMELIRKGVITLTTTNTGKVSVG